MTATESGSRGRTRQIALLRMALGTGQMVAALGTAALLLETGISRTTAVAFTVTTALLCTSLFLKYLGFWERGGRK